MADRAPPRPPMLQSFSATSLAGLGDKFREENDWTAAFTLLDTVETFFDSRIDLLERRFKKTSDRLLIKANEALSTRLPTRGVKTGDKFEKELARFRANISSRVTGLYKAWHSSQVIRTRSKISFFIGVMTVLASALLFGLAPEWVPVAYTVQFAYSFPYRVYTFKKKAWHYFLFDLCYYVNFLNLIFLWVLPGNAFLWQACYLLSHGPLASAVITWRNSLVFHDAEKVASLFIHIYPPFVFTVIRHFYPNSASRYPGMAKVDHLQPWRGLLLSAVIYAVWQGFYWKIVIVDRRAKISSGSRTTSFSFLLNDKRGLIGKSLSGIPPAYRESAFMFGQLVYSLGTELPALFLLYDSPMLSGIFLLFIFSVSVWNGGGYYIEVFGRKFERELEALRKELAEVSATASNPSSTPYTSTPPSPPSESAEPSPQSSPVVVGSDIGFSPEVLPNEGGAVETLNLSDLSDIKKDQ